MKGKDLATGEGKRAYPSRRFWLIIAGLVLLALSIYFGPGILFQIQYGGMPIAAWTGGFAPDCIWSASVVAWIDENHDGQHQPDEPLLPDVVFHVNGVNFHANNADQAETNANGEARLHVWLPGCPQESFQIYPDVPSGYTLTTQGRATADVRESDKVFEFGFDYLPGVPTATARPPRPQCTSYQIGVANHYDITDIAAALDGSIWVATYNDGVAHYVPRQDTWVHYRTGDGLVSNQVRAITPLRDGSIWFATDGGASRWDGAKWTSYTRSNGLVDDHVYKVAQAPDRSLWFATQGGVSHFVPSTATWISYTSKDGLADDFVQYVEVTPDGSVWLPTLLAGVSRFIPPTNTGTSGKWTTYDPYKDGASPIPFEDVSVIRIAPDGTAWFGGYDGLMRFDFSDGTWHMLDDNSRVDNTINSFTFGPDGSIWVAAGTTAPVIYHALPRAPISWEIYDSRDGIPIIDNPKVNEDDAVAVAVPSADTLWVATREDATRCNFSGR
ncbi:MAG TPA: two-component regulator propeller domain-containing protein [Anaerolineales bacterium]